MSRARDRKLTVAQLAEQWGWSRSRIYRLVYAQAIPFVRIGCGRGGIYFEESAVESWLEARRQRPRERAAQRPADEPIDWGFPVEQIF